VVVFTGHCGGVYTVEVARTVVAGSHVRFLPEVLLLDSMTNFSRRNAKSIARNE
jgi:hypothetical protein